MSMQDVSRESYWREMCADMTREVAALRERAEVAERERDEALATRQEAWDSLARLRTVWEAERDVLRARVEELEAMMAMIRERALAAIDRAGEPTQADAKGGTK